jgi:hypothetical protein
MVLIVILAKACQVCGRPENPDGHIYFCDDFDARPTGALTAGPAGAGGQWRILKTASDMKTRTHVVDWSSPGLGSSKRVLLLTGMQTRGSGQVSCATLRPPYRCEAYASMELLFNSDFEGGTNALTIALSQPNASRIARLVMEHAAGSDLVTLKLEDGEDASNERVVGTMTADTWHTVVWGNDARNETVTLAVDSKVVLSNHPVVSQTRARGQREVAGFVSQLMFYPGRVASVYLDTLKVSAKNPLSPVFEPSSSDYTAEPKEGVMCIDFFDLAYFDAHLNHKIYTVDQIRELLVSCKAAGIHTVLWRVSACGSVVYRSRVENWKTFRADKRVSAQSVADILEYFYDPLWEGCRICHELGIKVFAWVTLYDEGLIETPHYSRLLYEHPEYQWTDRTGKHYMEGVPSYAFKEARRFRVELIREVLSYPVDGLFLSLRSHSVSNPSYKKDVSEYGYEDPVVEAYQHRYGVDIRQETFDREKWHRIKGEFFTQLLRDIKNVTPADLPVWLCIVSTYGDGPTSKTQHALDYKTWRVENLVQGIVVCGPKIQEGEASASSGALLAIQPMVIEKYGLLRDMGFALYYFASVDQRKKCRWDYIPQLVNHFQHTPFQGIAIMEAFRFQLGDWRWSRTVDE